MNNRPIDPKLTQALFTAILDKISKAKSKDAFYLQMAIGRGINKKFNASQIPNFGDLCYNLYLVTAKEIATFDLFQLAQISNFMSSPEVTQAVPDEFWTESLEPALEEHLGNFVKFKDQLDRPSYLADFIKSLVGFGVRELSTPLFLAKVERVIQPHVNELDNKSVENLLFFVMRAGTSPN
jgi:hypothetical protein